MFRKLKLVHKFWLLAIPLSPLLLVACNSTSVETKADLEKSQITFDTAKVIQKNLQEFRKFTSTSEWKNLVINKNADKTEVKILKVSPSSNNNSLTIWYQIISKNSNLKSNIRFFRVDHETSK